MTDDERIARILGEWQEDRERGGGADPEQVIRDHPQLADALKERFAALRSLEVFFAGESGTGGPEPRTIGEYRIVREIGRGGMGVVYEAEQASLGRRVALKVLPVAIHGTPQAAKRFQREAKAAARLHHTNIVPVYAMGQDGGHWYYAMELVRGQPLSAVIAELKGGGEAPTEDSLARLAAAAPEPPRHPAPKTASTKTGDRAYFVRVAAMFAGVAEALDLAHSEGIVHRDIKPGNLLLDVDGTLKIVDFGLARLDDENLSMTITGDLLGTPVYMSPEQAMAKRMGLDHRTDIYSLGATLYEVLTLRPPFEARSLQELCSQIITKDPALPRGANRRIPRDLETIVLKAMEKDRDKRYQSARAFARDLRTFAEGGAIQARRIGAAGRAWRRVSRHKVRSALVAALVVAVGVGVWLAWRVAAERERARSLDYARLCSEGEQAVVAAMSRSSEEILAPVDSASFDAAIALLPDRPEAYLGRALVPGRPIEARLADLDEARARGLAVRTAHLARAHFLEGAGRKEEAQQERTRAAEHSGDGPLDLYFEARMLIAQSRWDEARNLLTRVISAEDAGLPVRYSALGLRAESRSRAGDHALALEDLVRLQSLGGDSASLRAAIASIWRKMDAAAAERSFEEALAQMAGVPEGAWRGFLSTLHDRGHYDWLDRATRQAIEAYPNSAPIVNSRGVAYTGRRSYPEALAAFERAIVIHPEFAIAHSNRGTALNYLHRYEEALAACDRALALDPDFAAACDNRGNALDGLRRYEEALAAHDRAIQLDPNLVSAHSNRSISLMKQRRYEEALAACDRALELDPSSAFAQCNRSNTLMFLHRDEEALAAADRALAVDPEMASAHTLRGRALHHLGRYEEALAAHDRAIELGPSQASAHDNRGSTLGSLGRYGEALSACDRALELDPNHVAAHNHRGVALSGLGRHQEALAAHDRALELDPAEPTAHTNRGSELSSLGHYEEAVAALDRALELDPNLAGAHCNRGDALYFLGRYEEALAACDRALELDPKLAETHTNRGNALQGLGRYQEALSAQDRAVEMLPRDATAHCNRGTALLALGRHEEALAAYARALELDPGMALAYVNRGGALIGLGRYEEALESCDRALKLDPGMATACTKRGDALHCLGRIEEALAAHDRAVELGPNLWTAHHNRGETLRRAGRPEDALGAYDRALAIRPDSAITHRSRGIALSDLGRAEEAIAAYDRAIQIEPASYAAYTSRAVVLNNLGRYAEALEAVEMACRLDPGNAHSHYVRAFALRGLERLEDARAAAQRSVALGPGNGFAHELLALVEWRDKRYDEARASFERAASLGSFLGCASFLADCEEPRYRDPERALELARRFAASAPGIAPAWEVLAAAAYRAGAYEECIAAVEKAIELDSNDPEVVAHAFFAAMALQRLGRTNEARRWYERGTTAGTDPGHASRLSGRDRERTERWRAEAAEVLGIKERAAAGEGRR